MSTQLSDEQAVREAVANFNHAALACDGEALAALLGEGLVYSHSNALLENKAEDEVILDAKSRVTSGKFDSITVDQVFDTVEQVFNKDNQPTFFW